MLPPPHQKPYTLLLSIDDLLVTSTWDVSRVAFSSPFFHFFLQSLANPLYSASMAGAQQNALGLTISSRISRNSMRLSSSQRNTTMYGPLLFLGISYLQHDLVDRDADP